MAASDGRTTTSRRTAGGTGSHSKPVGTRKTTRSAAAKSGAPAGGRTAAATNSSRSRTKTKTAAATNSSRSRTKKPAAGGQRSGATSRATTANGKTPSASNGKGANGGVTETMKNAAIKARVPAVALGAVAAGVAGGVALRSHTRRRTVLGVPIPRSLAIDPRTVAKTVGHASRQFAKTSKSVSRDIERAGEQAERIGKILS